MLMAPVLFTGLGALYVPAKPERLRLILAFSAAYLFTIAIIHMLPEAFMQNQVKQTGLFIVVGFCIQLVIDTFSTGIEHGHVHLHSHECKTHLPYGIIVGLLLHSFLEGLPVYSLNQADGTHVNEQLILGLAVHNFPITIAFVALLKEHAGSRTKNMILVVLFSCMAPLGYLSSYILQSFGLNDYVLYSRIAYAQVIGIFLHISTAILFESSEHHRYNIAKAMVMTAGIVVAYFVS